MASSEDKQSDEQDPIPEGSLNNIWEDDMIEKISNKENGKSSWRCKWCNKVFSGWNATKALHVTKATKVDIKPCTAVIDKYHKVLYDQLAMKNTKKKNNNEECRDLIDRMITSHNDVTATTLDSSKRSSSTKRSGSFNSSTISSKKQKSFLETGSIISQQSSIVSSSGDKDKTVQRLLYDGPNPSGESRCTMAVADMIHGCGLPFTLASHLGKYYNWLR